MLDICEPKCYPFKFPSEIIFLPSFDTNLTILDYHANFNIDIKMWLTKLTEWILLTFHCEYDPCCQHGLKTSSINYLINLFKRWCLLPDGPVPGTEGFSPEKATAADHTLTPVSTAVRHQLCKFKQHPFHWKASKKKIFWKNVQSVSQTHFLLLLLLYFRCLNRRNFNREWLVFLIPLLIVLS